METMRAFLTQRIDSDEELNAQLRRVESKLAVARKVITDGERLLNETDEEKQVAKVETRRMGEEKEAAEAKWKNTEHEMDQLKKELEELWAGFTTEKNELEKDYQKQVDEIFFFGYQCCMRKNDIT